MSSNINSNNNSSQNNKHIKTIRWIEIIAILITGIWALYNFIYREYFVPKNFSPYIVVDSKLTTLNSSKSIESLIPVKFNISINNNSKTKIQFLETIYFINASKIKSTKNNDYLNYVEETLNNNQYSKIPKYWYSDDTELIEVGKVLISDFYLEPNEKCNKYFVSFIPEEYLNNLITLNALFYIIKDKENIYSKFNISKNQIPYFDFYAKENNEKIKIDNFNNIYKTNSLVITNTSSSIILSK